MEGKLEAVKIEERYTESEKTMTESELLGLMEKYGIGTDASMATHIKNIIGWLCIFYMRFFEIFREALRACEFV